METEILGCKVWLPKAITLVFSDGRTVEVKYGWRLRPAVRHWYAAWVKRMPRG